MRVYLGYDPREALGTWVFQHSILKRTSEHVEFIPLDKRVLSQAPQLKDLPASNSFIFARYMCAHLSGYHGGPVLFADGADQVCLADVAEIKALWQPDKAVQVVKRPPYTPTPYKFKGTEMESPNKAYPCKQWSSVMLINPGHFGWRRINWQETNPDYWHGFGWLSQNEIGELPPEWNCLVDEGDKYEVPWNEVVNAKIMHWTLGVPAMHEYRHAPGYEIWWREAADAMNVCDKRWINKLQEISHGE